MMNTRFKLSLMFFMELAVWGAYLISMGSYLASVGLGPQISYFFVVQGIVSLFMPAILGVIADRWIQAQKVYSMAHALAGLSMMACWIYCATTDKVEFGILFPIYSFSVAFFMPTIALANSVAFNAMKIVNLDTVKDFPNIRVFATIGFIVTMLVVDWLGLQTSPAQFAVSGGISIVLALYSLTMPKCEIDKNRENQSLADALGLSAFTLFKQKKMFLFFFFAMFLGGALQITNSYGNPFISSFGADPAFAGTFGVEHANTLISISQLSETFCILLIPFFMKRYGIKVVMLMSMIAWVLRFGLFAVGDPGMPGVILWILSMIVYGVAFDFFNVSGFMFVEQTTPANIRSSAQGLFMQMTNGVGGSLGLLAAGAVVNNFVHPEGGLMIGEWTTCWYIFAGYALVVAILFFFLFKNSWGKVN